MHQIKVALFSHTHWDREWYRTFQEFRFGLVTVIDQILNLLQAGEYENFILDGQTIVLEDYLEICPDLKASLAGWIKKGKLVIGPWYILPDEFLISGESIIRNLLLGKSIAEDFGKSQTIGYLPDMFGHIAQMPQIIKGFGIDRALVWRGVNPSKCLFLWKGLDQTTIITVHLTEGYYNTFLINYEKQKEDLAKHLEKLEKNSYNDMILFPNGGDHLAPAQELKEVLHKISVKFPRYKFIQSTLEDYFQHLRINEDELEVISGELRDPEIAYILPGVFSARMYLKQRNHKLQTLLTNWVEPLSSFNWLLGNEYYQGFINLAWKNLLQNQPHDSICGCSVDQVHKEMMQRYDSGDEICQKLIEKTMESIAASISLEAGNYYLIAFNMSNWTYSGVEEFTLDFPITDNVENFRLADISGQEIQYEILEQADLKKFISEINVLPDWIEIRRFKILLKIDNVIPLGFKAIKILLNQESSKQIGNSTLKIGTDFIENEYLKLNVSDGKLQLESLISHDKYLVNSFESSGDAGDEYNYSPAKEDILSSAIIESTELESRTNLKATLKINYQLKLPEQLAESRNSLNKNFVTNEITSYITLKENDPLLYFKTEINNIAKDHRLKVNFSGNLSATQDQFKCIYDTQFGLLEKVVKVNDRSFDVDKHKERIEEIFAIQSFADLSTDNSGLAIITKGLPEVEITSKSENIYLSLTLLRCVGWLSRDDLRTRGGGAGPAMPTPDAQCQGINTFEYAIYPHSNSLIKSDVIKNAYQGISGIKLLQYNSPQSGAPVSEYRNKSAGSEKISLNQPLLKLEPENLVMSCLKRSEDQDGIIFRFYNPMPYKQDFYVQPANNFSFLEVSRVRLDENKLSIMKKDSKGNYYGIIEPYQIISLEFITNTL